MPLHQMPTWAGTRSFAASAMKHTAPLCETLTPPKPLKCQSGWRSGTAVSLSLATQLISLLALLQWKIPTRASGWSIDRPLPPKKAPLLPSDDIAIILRHAQKPHDQQPFDPLRRLGARGVAARTRRSA